MPHERVSDLRPISDRLRDVQDRLVSSAGRRRRPERPPQEEADRIAVYERSPETVRNWLLRKVKVPPRYVDLQIDEPMIPPRARDLLETWKGGGSLLLAGPPGSGKTATVVYLLRELWKAAEIVFEDDEAGGWVPRWTAPSMLFLKVRRLYQAVFERDRAPIRAALEAQVLALDDWGAAYEHEWPLAELDGLVDDRWDRELSTIVTTNLPVRTFELEAGRAFSRLCSAPGPGVVVLDRKDLRRAPE